MSTKRVMTDLPGITDERGWGEWMLKQLTAISLDNEGAWMRAMLAQTSGPQAAGNSKTVKRKNAKLESTITTLREAFPERTWTSPNGSIYSGHALPQSVLRASFDDDDRTHVHGHLMNMARSLDGTTVKTMAWLMASGFDPTSFNPHTQNTTLGGSAYQGQAHFVALFRKAGFDLSLRLQAEHLDDPIKHASLVGTTLLHRMAQRYPRMKAQDADAVLTELLLSGLDPLEENAGGQTALFLSRDGGRALLERWIADQQLASLGKNTPAARGRRKPARRL